MLQGLFHFFPEAKLKGAFVEPPKPEFAVDSFLMGSFQKKWEAYEDYNFGFRGALIKLKNAVEYILFREIDNTDIVEGRQGVLYSLASAERTMCGKFYNGREKNTSTISRINFLRKGIEKHGGHFFVVIAPSKESVIPEYLPSFFDGAVSAKSDYRDFLEGYRRDSISFLDIPEYFRSIKHEYQYPLFTKTGFHWSAYGASLAQDTIVKYCQSLLAQPMPSYIQKGFEWSDTARGADADFEEVMNLPFSLQEPPYVYPKLEMLGSTLKNKRPKVIIIGDSFFWQIKNLKILANVFSEDSRFWYYFKTSFPLNDDPGTPIKDIDVVSELETADFVILAGSLGTLGDFPFGVTEHYQESKGRMIYLKAANGKYVCADEGRNNIVIADRTEAAGWETFSLLNLSDSTCAIRSQANRYFSAELGMNNEVTASRNGVAGWEMFTMIQLDGEHVAFKAANGKYLSVNEKTLQIFAKGNAIGRQEKFELIEK